MKHCDAFDYWGRGTEVTVSSETAASPTLFPLVQCSSGNEITVGCLARDFYPKTLTFQWTDVSGTILTSVEYPPVVKGNKYTGVSLVKVPKSDWNSRKSFQCSVNHTGSSENLQVQKPITDDMTPVIRDPTVHKGDGRKPKVTVHVLPEEDISKGDSAEVTLVCLVSSPVQQNYDIIWSEYKEQQTYNYTHGINFPPQKTKHGYSFTSVYAIGKHKWNDNYMVYCGIKLAGSDDPIESRTVSKAQDSAPESKLSFALSCTEDAVEEDEFSSLWSTTSSFIFLFISSFVYSMIFTLTKMKRE